MAKLTKLNRRTWPKYAKEKLGIYPEKIWDLSHLWIYYSYRRKKVFEFLKKEANRTGFILEYKLDPDKFDVLDEYQEKYHLPFIDKANRLYNTNNDNYTFLDKPVRVLIYDQFAKIKDSSANIRHICMVPTECIIPINNNDLLWENIIDDIPFESTPEPEPSGIDFFYEYEDELPF
jgi:hypothetical protein